MISLSVMAVLAIGTSGFGAEPFKTFKKPGDPDITVQVQMARGAKEATLVISTKIPAKAHIYSTRTSDNFNKGRETKVTFDKGAPWVMVGTDFTTDQKPHSLKEDAGDEKVDVEQFEDQVTFKRQIKLKSGAIPKNAVVGGLIVGQMCNDKTCRRFKYAFQAQVKVVE